MKSQAYLNEIRKAAGLKRAVLKKIVVENGEAVFFLVTDCNYTSEDVGYASRVSARYAEGLRASARVMKSVPDEEGIRRAVWEIVRSRFPAFSAFLTEGDISAAVDGSGGRFFLDVTESELSKGREDGVIDAVSEALCRSFCGSWIGEFRFRKKEENVIEREVPRAEIVFSPRFFPVTGFEPIDGADPRPENAVYIADLDKEMQGVTVCGRVVHIEERETKNGKPFFSVSVTDGTGTLRASYFTRKATLEKVRAIQAGESVCLTGNNEIFGGGLSFRVKYLDLGAPPAGFVPEERPSKPVPVQYRAVFPVPEADLVQPDFFGVKPLPASFSAEDFVVFDLETTGLGLTAGAMDHIIEIGAVKIHEGRIAERFASFVACPVRLSAEIVGITGITDDMLVGAPAVSDVIADFYKFADGCALVGHNVQFDCKFIRYYGEREGYRFDHRQYDTLALAQELLHLKNYQLNTVADHFKFEFNHHRAYEDAFVTAKIFIELIRMRGELPR